LTTASGSAPAASFVVSQFTCCYVEILTSTIVMLEQQLALASGRLPLIS